MARSATDTARRIPSDLTPSAPTRTSRGGLGWVIPGAVLAIAALAWGTYNVLGVLAHGDYTERSVYATADVAALDIRNDSGSVTVDAGDVDEIVVTAEVDDGWRRTELSQHVVDGVLELRGSCSWLGNPWCSVDFTVTIPADIPVTVDGSNGSVTVRGVDADVDADTDDGTMLLEDLSGAVRGSSNNGRVIGRRLSAATVDASTNNGRVELSFIVAPDSVRARTDNGRVEVIVPDHEVAYRVEMNTRHGSTDNAVRTDPASEHVIEASTRNGSITVRPPG